MASFVLNDKSSGFWEAKKAFTSSRVEMTTVDVKLNTKKSENSFIEIILDQMF